MPSDPPSSRPPCVLHEDEHLLVVDKPAGLNTHAPGPFAGEGIYEWLRHREPRWAELAIIHRLDKETSGVLVFGKTTLANRSLTEQFTQRSIRKKYLLLTDRPVKDREFVVRSRITRTGSRYTSSPKGEEAETRFRLRDSKFEIRNSKLLEAEPLTGRTHQIRVQAAENGFPVLGDTLYGGSAFPRVCLHASDLTLRHPASGENMTFHAPVNFLTDPRPALRDKLINVEETNACRLIHGASDGWPGWYVDRLGDFLLSQSGQAPTHEQLLHLRGLSGVTGVYHKRLSRPSGGADPEETSPQHLLGKAAPEHFLIFENGTHFELSFHEGYSVGLFLDQRDNRRRLLTHHIAAGFPPFNSKLEILNTFAYTCGFSVCAARAGDRTVNLDLSKKYLEWGKHNFELNGLSPAEHEFIYGDVFDWLRRLAKKGRTFDLVLLDPPTFSRSKAHGTFRAMTDYGRLISSAIPLLKPGGILFASSNTGSWEPEKFLAALETGVQKAKRGIRARHYGPQPPDFPISSSEPAYLKTFWAQIG